MRKPTLWLKKGPGVLLHDQNPFVAWGITPQKKKLKRKKKKKLLGGYNRERSKEFVKLSKKNYAHSQISSQVTVA